MTATIKPDANQPRLTQPAAHQSPMLVSRRNMIKQTAAGLSVPLSSTLLLSACQTKEPPLPQITKPGGMVNLGVAAVDVINDYKPPLAMRFILIRFSTHPLPVN